MTRQFLRLVLLLSGLSALAVWLLFAAIGHFENNPGSLAEIAQVVNPPGQSPASAALSDLLIQFGSWLAGHHVDIYLYVLLIVLGVVLLLRSLRARRPLPSSVREAGSDLVTPPASPMRASANLAVASRGWRWRAAMMAGAHIYLSRLAGGFTARMNLAFVGTVALFGMVVLAVIYFSVTSTLRREQFRRAEVIGVNASDVAAPYVVGKKANDLRELLRKQATRQAVAYVIVEDRKAQIFAHSLAVLPEELKTSAPFVATPGHRTLHVGSAQVYEVTVPVLDGRVGLVRVGLWRDDVELEISQTLRPLLRLVLAVIVAGLVLAVFLVWRINRPILSLVQRAHSISTGQLDMPLTGTDDRGEYGELSRAMERLRSSVRAAMARLAER